MRGLVLILGLALGVAALTACTDPFPSPADGRLRVVATTTQVGEAARGVGGEDIALTVLLKPGAEAHEFEITPTAAAAIEKSDVILESGAGLETWLEGALRTLGGGDRLHDMSAGVELRAPDDPAGAGNVDPHYWLTAPNASRMVENVRDALSDARPELADAFAARASAYLARLEAADVEIRRLMAEIPPQRRGIVTNHDAIGYFLAEYGLRFVGSVFPSLDVSAEPDPRQLAALADTIRSEGVTAIFSESAVNPKLARAIAAETGAQVVDEPLYTDSLGAAGSGADTLDGMLLYDAQVIHDALVPHWRLRPVAGRFLVSDVRLGNRLGRRLGLGLGLGLVTRGLARSQLGEQRLATGIGLLPGDLLVVLLLTPALHAAASLRRRGGLSRWVLRASPTPQPRCWRRG